MLPSCFGSQGPALWFALGFKLGFDGALTTSKWDGMELGVFQGVVVGLIVGNFVGVLSECIFCDNGVICDIMSYCAFASGFLSRTVNK